MMYSASSKECLKNAESLVSDSKVLIDRRSFWDCPKPRDSSHGRNWKGNYS
jgi:hypothetical protein